MLGYRFYLEYPNKQEKAKGRAKLGQLGNHCGTVVCVPLDDNDRPLWHVGSMAMDAYAAVCLCPNSPVCSTSVGWEYLQDRCKRVSEKIAREVHPAMFEYLES